ncbi:hypothetical protein FHR99_000028 [Litorivivens lipolytica]|uniref:Outer membrane protein beta-barrel domain-containing protein n=1 Tax=Litorivivens lipolytica TaxID=1524264 RepID=A0A7W4W2N2_9GAMM|nr:porin family protein [Litorivivens lipolytica]MBB3045792.1 hypothetical protein [Litorivivens lipolytica]
MKKMICFAAAGLIAAGASAQQSQPELYGSASYGLVETEVGSVDFDTPTLNLAFGGKFNPNFALEGRLGFGVDDDTENGVEVEIDNFMAIYAKPMLPVSDVITLYGLLGLAETEIDTNFGNEDDDDISYGLGISARLNNGIDLFGEYVSLYDDDDVEISGINLGASMRF